MALSSELRLTIASLFAELELVDQAVDAFLQALAWDPDELPNVSLAVREAAANAIQHGNRLEPDLPVEILCTVEGTNLLVQVADRGDGFDPETLPDPLAPENLLKPTGRGILLIRNFMDGVTFEFPEAGGTLVSMRKRITAAKPGPSRDLNQKEDD